MKKMAFTWRRLQETFLPGTSALVTALKGEDINWEHVAAHWCSADTVNTIYSVRPLIKHASVPGTTLSLGIKGVLEAVEDLS